MCKYVQGHSSGESDKILKDHHVDTTKKLKKAFTFTFTFSVAVTRDSRMCGLALLLARAYRLGSGQHFDFAFVLLTIPPRALTLLRDYCQPSRL